MKYEVKLEGCQPRTVEADNDQDAIRRYNETMGIISTKRVYHVYATIVENEGVTMAGVDEDADEDEPTAESPSEEPVPEEVPEEVPSQEQQSDVYGDAAEVEPPSDEEQEPVAAEAVPIEQESESPAAPAVEEATAISDADEPESVPAETDTEPEPTLREKLEGMTRNQLKELGQAAEAAGKLTFDARWSFAKMVESLEEAGVDPDVVA